MPARELEPRSLLALEHWSEAVPLADKALALAERTGFRSIEWRMRAARARVRRAAGDPAGADEDRGAAGETLRALAANISDDELRAAFEADPLAVEVLG